MKRKRVGRTEPVDRLRQLSLHEVLSLEPRPASVLEIGCGDGGFLLALATALPEAGIVGVDLSESALSKAASTLDGQSHVQVLRAAAEDLPLPTESFDVVVANRSFHHWRNWDTGLAESNRVLRPHGTLVVADALVPGVTDHPLDERVAERLAAERIPDEAAFDAMLDAAGFVCVRRIPDPSSAGVLFVTVATPSNPRFQQEAPRR